MSTNHLIDLLTTLSRSEVKFIICGGVAAVLHGVERMTLDLDITIDMETENIKRFLEAAQNSGLEPRAPIAATTLLDPELVQLLIKEKNAKVFSFVDKEKPWRQVDVFISDDYAYEKMVADTVVLSIAGYGMRVVSKEKLILMKKAVFPLRQKDLFDIQALMNGMDS